MAELSGKCLCGSVKVTATPRSKEVGSCHCNLCRKWAAGPFMALDCGSDVHIEAEDNLGVFKSSEWAERAFCKNCGTLIAWRLQDGGEYHPSAQLFEETADYPLGLQVFIDEKPGNYSFAEQTETMTGAEVFAAFAASEESSNA
ncbi:GFA family protein [Ahrensia sp. R2A130]|uniref:GFA family protein n=1 Tax=Ahrensia sp. R2A130 TaxID=744979 RepID=UPI0001E09405|nr:GFA family protein [Ahrensia sp. R2A130]EFL89988.1 glutathione-dependent formaldehyde-activating, GFA [Ahrensia sp. R2A130]